MEAENKEEEETQGSETGKIIVEKMLGIVSRLELKILEAGGFTESLEKRRV